MQIYAVLEIETIDFLYSFVQVKLPIHLRNVNLKFNLF